MRRNLKWWSLITALIEVNISMLTFDCGIQLIIPHFHTFFNKLNILTTILALFVILFYAVVFYPIIYRFERRKNAETILTHTKYGQRSFLLESFCFLLRNFIRSLIQSTFMLWYSAQLILLCISNVICLGFCFYFRKAFLNRFVLFLTVFYHIALLNMDISFLINFKYP